MKCKDSAQSKIKVIVSKHVIWRDPLPFQAQRVIGELSLCQSEFHAEAGRHVLLLHHHSTTVTLETRLFNDTGVSISSEVGGRPY